MNDIDYALQLEDGRWHEIRRTILRRDGHKCCMCGTKGSEDNHLNIHHRYYIYDNMAWEYDESALITLCQQCHALVHQTISPFCYLDKGDYFLDMEFTPCLRCSGAGYFPEFSHIEHGVCFRCRGKRYEELTDKNYKLKSIYSTRTVFDIPRPTDSLEEIEANYKAARQLHFSGQAKKAKALYKKSAAQGHPKAQNNLGFLLKQEGDYDNALRWFAYSAMQGIHQASSNIIELFENGCTSLTLKKSDIAKWKKVHECQYKLADIGQMKLIHKVFNGKASKEDIAQLVKFAKEGNTESDLVVRLLLNLDKVAEKVEPKK